MNARKEAVLAALRNVRATDEIVEEARRALELNFPEQTYNVAVWSLGVATNILIVGAVLSLLLERGSSDAVWTAVGAGVGGLAGVFAANSGR